MDTGTIVPEVGLALECIDMVTGCIVTLKRKVVQAPRTSRTPSDPIRAMQSEQVEWAAVMAGPAAERLKGSRVAAAHQLGTRAAQCSINVQWSSNDTKSSAMGFKGEIHPSVCGTGGYIRGCSGTLV